MCKKKSKNIPQNHYNSKYDNAINFNQGIITSTIRRIMKRCQPGSRDNAGKKQLKQTRTGSCYTIHGDGCPRYSDNALHNPNCILHWRVPSCLSFLIRNWSSLVSTAIWFRLLDTSRID